MKYNYLFAVAGSLDIEIPMKCKFVYNKPAMKNYYIIIACLLLQLLKQVLFLLLYQAYFHVKKPMEQAFQLYGPSKLAGILFRKEILNPVHYYIMGTLKDVSESYQSSVLYEMLTLDIEITSKYQKFRDLVKKDTSLEHISSIITDIGKGIKQHELVLY